MAFCFHHSNGLKSALVSAARRESATSVCPELMTLRSLLVLPQVRPYPLLCPQTPHLHRSQKKLSQRYLLEHYPFGPFHNFHTTAGSHFGPCLYNFRRLFRKCADAHAAPLFRILCPHIRRSPNHTHQTCQTHTTHTKHAKHTPHTHHTHTPHTHTHHTPHTHTTNTHTHTHTHAIKTHL